MEVEGSYRKRDTDMIGGLISGALITLIYWLIDSFFDKRPSIFALIIAILIWGYFLFGILLRGRGTIFETQIWGAVNYRLIFILLIVTALLIFFIS